MSGDGEFVAFLLGSGISAIAFFILGYLCCRRDPYQNIGTATGSSPTASGDTSRQSILSTIDWLENRAQHFERESDHVKTCYPHQMFTEIDVSTIFQNFAKELRTEMERLSKDGKIRVKVGK